MSQRLRDALMTASDEMATARLASDTWQRGRRARWLGRLRRWLAGLLAVIAATALGNAALRPGFGVRGPDVSDDAVPRSLDLPWPWQATIQMDPPGAASVMFGGDALGLSEPYVELLDSSRMVKDVAVVSRVDGDTRMYRTGWWSSGGVIAGEDILLSPDGTRIVGIPPREAHASYSMAITDLATGRSTVVTDTGGRPLAWAPDGRSILLSATGAASPIRDLRWLDVDTLRSTPVEVAAHGLVRSPLTAAVSPDSSRALVAAGNALTLVDRTGGPLWTVDVGPNAHLAGGGAFTLDGTRICVANLDAAAQLWTFTYLDVSTGAATDGPDLPSVAGQDVRALGWTRDGALVVLRTERTGHVTLLGLSADAAVTTLLDPPEGVQSLDVARDLIVAGRFGGPSSHASLTPVRALGDWWYYLIASLIGVLTALAVVRGWIRRRRRRRNRVRPPAGWLDGPRSPTAPSTGG